MCRRSPSPCDRWHIRQPVPAARFTAVLPRGSGGDTGGARRNRQGMGSQRKDRGSGGPETSGVVAGNRGVRSGRWRCRSGTRSPTACDPSASLTGPAVSRPERARPSAVDWRGAPRPLRASGIAGPGNGQAGQPRAEGPKGGLTRLYGPGTSRRRPPAPGVHGCQVSAVGGAVRLRATVSTDAGTRGRMMRTRSARPRTIRSASPVRSWPTASCRRGPWPTW
jgi:hypothetical protein